MDSGDTNYKPSNLCVNSCGFYGSPSTLNFCSKCYREYQLVSAISNLRINTKAVEDPAAEVVVPPPVKAVRVYKGQDKCWTCKRRVKIARGFKCRCGFLFCESHRYPEEHRCSFDYKAMGKFEIAKLNPRVGADKIVRM